MAIVNCIKTSFLQDIRYPVNFIFGVLTPIFSLLPILMTIQLFQSQNSATWYLIGLVIWMYLTQVIWGNGVILKNEKTRGTLEQLLLTPKRISTIIYAKSLYFVIKAVVSFALIIEISNAFIHTNMELSKMLLVIIIGLPFYYSVSIIVSLFCLNVDYTFPVLQTILGFIMIFSGLTYEIDLGERFNFLNNGNIVYQLMLLARNSSSMSFTQLLLCKESIIIIVVGLALFVIMQCLINRFTKKLSMEGAF